MTILQESLVRISALIVICGVICPVMALVWSVFCKWLESEKTAGRHRRNGMRRRRLKSVLIVSLSIVFLFALSWKVRGVTEAKKDDEPTMSQLCYARNLYMASGYCGEAKVYIDRWPEYADYITGMED